MKVLIVCSRRYYAPYTEYVAPFIYEQVQALRAKGVEFEYYLIAGGWRGYVRALWGIPKAVRSCRPDIVHGHSGLCCLVAALSVRLFTKYTPKDALQKTENSQSITSSLRGHGGSLQVKVFSTFHGSDVNSGSVRWLSRWAMWLSDCNIFVSEQLLHKAGKPKNAAVVPCSVDTTAFRHLDRTACRKQLGWEQDKTYILFSKEFADRVKNYPLAKAAVDTLYSTGLDSDSPNPLREGASDTLQFPSFGGVRGGRSGRVGGRSGVVLLELFGYTREQMPLLYNACDCALMTSFTEGSPQFIKEAVACGCPVVSTDVGDVREVVAGVPNAFLCDYEATDVAHCLRQAMAVGHLSSPALPARYTTPVVADTLYALYQKSVDL